MIDDKKRYIFARRNLTKPRRKLFGSSEYKIQITEHDRKQNIYTKWNKTMINIYFMCFCVKTEELKYKLISLKSIK